MPTPSIADLQSAAFQSPDLAACYAHFLPLACAIPTDTLEVFKGRPHVMLHNAEIALSLAEPHLAAALVRWPDAPIAAVAELPAVLRGLIHATARVPAKALSTGEIDALFDEASPWRDLTLRYLEVVSHPLLNLVSAARVKAIREGTGKTNTAQDFAAIAALFAECADALDGRHPFPAEKLNRLGAIGAQLISQLKPKGASRITAPRTPESIERDQFAALARRRYDALMTLVAVAVGFDAARELLPALGAAYDG